MKRALLAVLVCVQVSTASAATLPELGGRWFVGSTVELWKIRRALDVAAGYDPDGYWHLLAPPWGMGAVDCMEAGAFPGEPYDTSTPYLGMSVQVDGEIVEIPTFEELATQATWPGECYGYKFREWCSDPYIATLICPDP
jgi:hypothetical protein